MMFQIKELILWPRNTAFSPRRVPFARGKVTVISGASRTGKSAVIPIIDYCLASSACLIPVKTIREASEWFGIVVSTADGDKLLARREPGSQRSTDDMFILEAPSISEVPRVISKNTSAPEVRRLLDELAGLSNLDFGSGDAQQGFDARPSFRDLSAFTFQPQNVVANPEVLFFKTDRYEHREKLRKIFPYVLGAITPTLLAKQHELRRLQVEVKRKERELRDAQQVSAQWIAELRARVSEAREFGLVPTTTPGDLLRDAMITLLDEIVHRTDATLAVSASTISDAVRELNALDNEESTVSHDLTKLRWRLTEMNRVRESVTSYREALRIQRDRLSLADWLGTHRSGDEKCPLCGGGAEPSEKVLHELQASLVELAREAGDTFEVPAAFDREFERVQMDVNDVADKLKAIQIRKRALAQRSKEANDMQYQAKKVERFIGNLENALTLYRRLGEDGGLAGEVETLRERVGKLTEELRQQNLEERKRRALRIVNGNAARLMPLLDSERPTDPVSLDINDLTIRVTGTAREDYLSEIGSGSNWLSYHLAMSLGLQEFLITLDHNAVPGFVVFDQPSQVYFPKRAAVRESEHPDDPALRDEDTEAVRKAFEVMSLVVANAKGRLQIIVLDHAPREVWGSVANVVEFEEWRGEKKLVPLEWLSA